MTYIYELGLCHFHSTVTQNGARWPKQAKKIISVK